MSLPMMSTPTYTMNVPSSGNPVKFRPFLIKEEKALLIAQQSEDSTVMIDTLKNVIKSCVQDKLDVEKLATFDLEYMFVQIRGKSVGETIDLIFPCDTDHGDQNQKAMATVTIDINDIKVEKSAEHVNKIHLYNDVGVVLKYPTVDMLKKLEDLDDNDLDKIFDIMAYSIDYVYDGDQIYYSKEQKHEDLVQFINNLNSEQFLKLQKFFETMPRLRKEIEYDCPLCGKHHKKMLEGIQSFF